MERHFLYCVVGVFMILLSVTIVSFLGLTLKSCYAIKQFNLIWRGWNRENVWRRETKYFVYSCEMEISIWCNIAAILAFRLQSYLLFEFMVMMIFRVSYLW